MWEGSYWFALGSFTLGLAAAQVCCGLQTLHARQGRERRSETVLLAASLSVGAGRRTAFDLGGGGRVMRSSNTV